MNKENTETSKNRPSNTENLKKLAEVFFDKQELNYITEIRDARKKITDLAKKVRGTLSEKTGEKIVREPLPVIEEKISTSSFQKETETRTPQKQSASSFSGAKTSGFSNNYNRNSQTNSTGNNFRQQTQKPFGSRPPYNSNNSNNGSYNRPYGSRPPYNNGNNSNNGSYNRPFGSKPPYNSNRPFGSKPQSNAHLIKPAELDIDVKNLKPDRVFGNKKKTHEPYGERKQISKKAQMRWDVDSHDDYNEEKMGRRYKNKKKEEARAPIQSVVIDKAVITTENLTVKLLSEKIGKPAADIVKKLFILGIMATINSTLDFDTAELVASELGVTLEKKIAESAEQQLQNKLVKTSEADAKNLTKRPPIVTVMGHVDHGKTSLLDAIRKTNVISGEAGGITQAIGAYTVKINNQSITFIDTPGHAAFTAMRARGAQITDIAVLVVAADDGVMPQTIEAINHIKAANVPMIVAINKMDKPDANSDRVKKELADLGILGEEWGGDTIIVPIAAKKGENIDKLLEMILLVAEVQDLKANPSRSAEGAIVESKLDKGKGPVATVLIQNGTLKVGDYVLTGVAFGRIRAMIDENGKSIKKAGPSTPVAILGLDNVPQSGDTLTVVDEKMTKAIVQERKNKIKLDKIKLQSAKNIEELFQNSAEIAKKTVNIIIKADVQGSVEALKQSLLSLRNDEARVVCVHSGAGAIIESDVLLAQASNAIIIGFNVKPENKARDLAEKNNIQINLYKVIYECIENMERTLKGLMAPKYQEKVIGKLEVRQIFKISNVGTIAGCFVIDGKIQRNGKVRLLRNDKLIATEDIESLKIQKNEVKEAGKGFECGVKLKNFDDIKELDIFEVFIMEQINI